MAGPSHPPRRIYLVDRHFQLKYTALLVAFGGTVMGLFGAAVFREVSANSELLVGKRLEESLGKMPSLGDFQDALATSDHRMMMVVIGSAMIVAAALGLIGVLVTHRIAGPVYVLSRYAKALADGSYPQMRALRRGDELKGFFEVFREAIERMRERQSAEAAQLEQLAAQLTGPAADELRALAKVKRDSLGEPIPNR
jgi:methyl-accepting chemotaxis protein